MKKTVTTYIRDKRLETCWPQCVVSPVWVLDATPLCKKNLLDKILSLCFCVPVWDTGVTPAPAPPPEVCSTNPEADTSDVQRRDLSIKNQSQGQVQLCARNVPVFLPSWGLAGRPSGVLRPGERSTMQTSLTHMRSQQPQADLSLPPGI